MNKDRLEKYCSFVTGRRSIWFRNFCSLKLTKLVLKKSQRCFETSLKLEMKAESCEIRIFISLDTGLSGVNLPVSTRLI